MAKKPAAGIPAPAKNSTPATPAPKPAAAPAKAAAPAAPKPAKAPAPTSAPVASTAVRNSPVPKTTRPASPLAAAREVTQADIAKRAYEIWASGQGGSETDNWLRAERELRGL